jgi:WD40 repeat protein
MSTTIALLLACAVLAQGDSRVLWTNTFDVNFFKVQQVGFSSDSKYLAVGYHRGNVNIFTTDSGNVARNYLLHTSHVFCTKFRPGTHVVASGDKEGNVILYDYATDKVLHRIKAHEKPVTALYFTPDGERLLTGSKDKTIKVWDANTGALLHTMVYKGASKVQSLYVAADGNTVVAGITKVSRGLRYYDMRTGVETEKYSIGNLEHFDVSPDGTFMAIGSLNKNVYIFNMKRRAFVAKWKGHKRWVTDVCYNNTGKVLFTASNDNKVFAWQTNTTKYMPVYETKRDLEVVKCSPDGKYLALLDANGELTVLDVADIEGAIRDHKPPQKR